MTKAELEAWLCGDAALVATAAEIATVFGRRTVDDGDAVRADDEERLAGARFILAVLRDVFPDDASVRRWLLAPCSEWAGACGIDVLWRGQVSTVEDLAMREWHRRTVHALHPCGPRVGASSQRRHVGPLLS